MPWVDIAVRLPPHAPPSGGLPNIVKENVNFMTKNEYPEGLPYGLPRFKNHYFIDNQRDSKQSLFCPVYIPIGAPKAPVRKTVPVTGMPANKAAQPIVKSVHHGLRRDLDSVELFHGSVIVFKPTDEHGCSRTVLQQESRKRIVVDALSQEFTTHRARDAAILVRKQAEQIT